MTLTAPADSSENIAEGGGDSGVGVDRRQRGHDPAGGGIHEIGRGRHNHDRLAQRDGLHGGIVRHGGSDLETACQIDHAEG